MRAVLTGTRKARINWFINMAMWPTFYALLDKILLVMYYTLRDGRHFDSMITYTAFFCFYIIAYITIPISIQKANPYGVMHGMISTMSTITQVGGSVISSSMGGVSLLKQGFLSPKSNSEVAQGGGNSDQS